MKVRPFIRISAFSEDTCTCCEKYSSELDMFSLVYPYLYLRFRYSRSLRITMLDYSKQAFLIKALSIRSLIRIFVF